WTWERCVRTTLYVHNTTRRAATSDVSFTGPRATDAYSSRKPVASSKMTFLTERWWFEPFRILVLSSSWRLPQVKEPLLSLAPSDIRALSIAIETGRLSPPYPPSSVQRFVKSDVSVDVAAAIH